jgi:hypothetical protein
MVTLTDKIIDFIKIFPQLTATELSHKMHERNKLATISSILNRLVKTGRLFRDKGYKGAWVYDISRFEWKK